VLGATLVARGHDKVIPLQPEFITPQDGVEKRDCKNAAAKRPVRAVVNICGHFIFVCKLTSHPLIAEYIHGVQLEPTKGVNGYQDPRIDGGGGRGRVAWGTRGVVLTPLISRLLRLSAAAVVPVGLWATLLCCPQIHRLAQAENCGLRNRLGAR
jgi:hypothetical protein